KLLGYFLEKLAATPDGDGTLLDHSLILYGGGISDGDSHSHKALPLLLAGSGCGQLKGGRHLVYKDTPLANLLVSLLVKSDVPTERIGDSSGQLEDLSGV